jgi:phage terminase Nu1 subunit (DNA packaging protein)
MAGILGISARALKDMVARGTLTRERAGFPLADTVRSYCGHLRGVASGRGGEEQVHDLTKERARLAKEQADGHELKNRIARGELLDAGETELRWADMLRSFRSRMLAVPSRCRVRLGHLTVTDVDVIDREIRDGLAELGNGDDDGLHDDA